MYQSIGSIEVTEMLTQMTKGAEGDREAHCAEHRTPGSKTETSRARASIEESQENRLMREGNSKWEAVSGAREVGSLKTESEVSCCERSIRRHRKMRAEVYPAYLVSWEPQSLLTRYGGTVGTEGCGVGSNSVVRGRIAP